MAGQEIYLGKMIEALQTDIGTMVTTLNQHTIALGNINTTVAQTVSNINIKPGTDTSLAFTHPEVKAPSTAKVTVLKMIATANGTCNFSCNMKCQYGAPQLFYSYDNINWVKFLNGSGVMANYGPLTGILPVISGPLFIGIASPDSYDSFIKANSIAITYSQKDIVNEGAFAY
jgi:hypothetical protein